MWLFSLIFSYNIMAEVVSYRPLQFAGEEVQKISVKGFYGRVKVQGSQAQGEGFKISVVKRLPEGLNNDLNSYMDDWKFSYKNDSGHLQLSIKEPLDREIWLKTMQLKTGQFVNYDLVIQGPAKPLNVWWRDGALSVSQWSEALKIVQQRGNVRLSEVQSPVSVYLNEGELVFYKVKGPVDIESYKAKLNMTGYEGNLQLDAFSGSVDLQQTTGNMNIKHQNGRIYISDSNGNIDFNIRKSNLQIKKFSGDLQGKTESGPVEAHLVGSSNVRIQSMDGPVTLDLPSSTASVNIGSKKGQLIGPSYLRKNQWSSLKTLTGQLRGKNEGGRIHVRSEDGNIRIR